MHNLQGRVTNYKQGFPLRKYPNGDRLVEVIKSKPTTWVHLEALHNSFYRQLFVKGTRIRARTLYGLYMNADEPMTPDEIAAEYGLPLQAVQEAIAYCEADTPEIRQD